MSTTRGRLVQQNQVVLDQCDFFAPDGFTRVVGLNTSTLIGQVFFGNLLQPWVFVSGLGVTDTQVAAGTIYFNEITGSPGYYNVRFRPNALGYWRLLITYTAGQQRSAQDYDVTSSPVLVESGLTASFIKPPGKDC